MDFLTNNKIIRQRGENWTQEEKDLLLKIIRQSAPILKSKLTDTNTNKLKSNEWLKVQKKLEELSGKQRDVAQIKGFWKRLKQTAKTNAFRHKKILNSTCTAKEIVTVVDNKEVQMEKETDNLTLDTPRNKHYKAEPIQKDTIIETNIDIKKRTMQLLEEEYALKFKYQKQELCHQELRHELELDILLLEKEKKELEIKLLKKSFA